MRCWKQTQGKRNTGPGESQGDQTPESRSLHPRPPQSCSGTDLRQFLPFLPFKMASTSVTLQDRRLEPNSYILHQVWLLFQLFQQELYALRLQFLILHEEPESEG